jgi:hypothetical protein
MKAAKAGKTAEKKGTAKTASKSTSKKTTSSATAPILPS